MYYLLGFMLTMSLLAGSFILWLGIREVFQRWTNVGKMHRTQGTIIRIHTKYGRIAKPSGAAHARSQQRNYPVVRFTAQSGAPITFRSEIGDVGQTRYHVGQELPVLYDPMGRLKP